MLLKYHCYSPGACISAFWWSPDPTQANNNSAASLHSHHKTQLKIHCVHFNPDSLWINPPQWIIPTQPQKCPYHYTVCKHGTAFPIFVECSHFLSAASRQLQRRVRCGETQLRCRIPLKFYLQNHFTQPAVQTYPSWINGLHFHDLWKLAISGFPIPQVKYSLCHSCKIRVCLYLFLGYSSMSTRVTRLASHPWANPGFL